MPCFPRLIATADERSPGLVQAWAAIVRARAALVSTQADALPAVNASASASRDRRQSQSGGLSTLNTRASSLDASWALDLFDKVRNSAAAEARVGARKDDWHEARVSLSASSLASSLTTWSFGPSLNIPLFDGGKRRAAVDNAQAGYQGAVARPCHGNPTTSSASGSLLSAACAAAVVGQAKRP